MDQASMSLSERFRMALDFCDAAGARADATPVVSELRPRQVTFSEPLAGGALLRPTPAMSQWAPQVAAGPAGACVTRPPTLPPLEAPPPPESGELAPASKGGSTFKAIAIVVGVLLLAAAGWFVRRRFVEPFFARRMKPPITTESDEDEPQQLPLLPRKTPSWTQQAARQPEPRRVTFATPQQEMPRDQVPQRPQSAKGKRPGPPQRQTQIAPDKKREALLAAQRAVAAKNSAKAQELAQEDEASEEDEDAFFPAAEPPDPNFTEI